MARKRAPGGGRKASGEFTRLDASLSLRVTSDLRNRLEDAAAKNGQKLNQEILQRLNNSFVRETTAKRHRATRAFAYLVGYLASKCDVEIKGADKKFTWNTDATVFEAFRLVLTWSLERLRPKATPLQNYLSESKAHETWKEFLSSPDEMAKHVFRDVWQYLEVVKPISFAKAKGYLVELGSDADKQALEWSDESYPLSRLKSDLAITENKS